MAAIARLTGLSRLAITDWTTFTPSDAATMVAPLSRLTSLRVDRLSINLYSPEEVPPPRARNYHPFPRTNVKRL